MRKHLREWSDYELEAAQDAELDGTYESEWHEIEAHVY